MKKLSETNAGRLVPDVPVAGHEQLEVGPVGLQRVHQQQRVHAQRQRRVGGAHAQRRAHAAHLHLGDAAPARLHLEYDTLQCCLSRDNKLSIYQYKNDRQTLTDRMTFVFAKQMFAVAWMFVQSL